MDDDVDPGQHALELRLDPVCDCMTLADRRSRGHRDDHVGEGVPARLAQPQPRDLYRRLDPGDRSPRRLLRFSGGVVHEHVDVPADQPRGSEEHERRDEERGDRVAPGVPGRRGDQPGEHGERAAKSLPKWIAFERSASLR